MTKVQFKRPKIKPIPTLFDKAVELITGLLLVSIWVFAATKNFADDVLFISVILTIIYLGLTILSQYPHIFNYPVAITTENALKQYTLAVRLIRFLKLSIAVIFGTIMVSIHQLDGAKQLWLLPIILILANAPIAYYLYKALKG
jgi:hypothetical protein